MILVSACLLGAEVRYDGTALKPDGDWLKILGQENELLAYCPEVAAGLASPRACAEICGGDGHDVLRGTAEVLDRSGNSLTKSFIEGARKTLDFCVKNGVQLAFLAERSPSCGSSRIYDGTFSGKLVAGRGVSAALLVENEIAVFNQDQVSEALIFVAGQYRI